MQRKWVIPNSSDIAEVEELSVPALTVHADSNTDTIKHKYKFPLTYPWLENDANPKINTQWLLNSLKYKNKCPLTSWNTIATF